MNKVNQNEGGNRVDRDNIIGKKYLRDIVYYLGDIVCETTLLIVVGIENRFLFK